MDTTTMDTNDAEAAGQRPYRLDPQELPAGLAHGPSRSFLVRDGLPGRGAFLDFGDLAADGPAVYEPGGEGAGPLYLLGETDYFPHIAFSGSSVVLDGATGEVHLAERVDGGLRRDLLASDLPALAALIHETEAVAPAARQPDAYGGLRGPAVVAQVIAAAGRRMRAIDPRLYDGAAPPAHWDTALRVRALCWGAGPGGPGGLRYELDPGLVAEIAALTDEGAVRRYVEAELPAGLTHTPTRRLLTEVGLPLGGWMFAVHEGPLLTMAEEYPEYFGEADGPQDEAEERDYQRDYFALASWPTDLEVALDGATGRLELPDWYDDGEPAAYLNRDLSALLYALWTYERLREEWDRWEDGGPWAVFDPRALLHSAVDAAVAAVDPEAFATPGHSWQLLADDAHAGGLLS
ncbi:SUKH-4 family immunity protein [Kitasatospora sp. NPDC048239]|uniref:SUKH-4 family immunity protein n=1 Tax=Kitasatospora sp. NPDC048239 TaxID=3364046 RepID=UPI003716C9D2